MAKKSMVARERKRERMHEKFKNRRARLKAITRDESLSMEERFEAQLKLAELPRNSAKARQHNRCELTGRPHGYYRKFRISRIALRELGSRGEIPGIVKSSW